MVNPERAELIDINEFIICGQYKEANRSLESIKKSNVKLSVKEKMQSDLLLSLILFYQGNYNKSIKKAQSVFKKCQKRNDNILSLEALSIILTILNYQDEIQEISNWIKIGDELYYNLNNNQAEENITQLTTFLMLKGIYLCKLGDFEDARISLHQALLQVQEIKNEPLKAEILCNIANLYLKQGNIDLAIENYQESLNIWEAISNFFVAAKIKNDLAYILTLQGDIHLALAILQQELEIVMRNTDKMIIGAYQYNIGLVYLEMNRIAQTLDWFKLSLKNFKAANNKRKTAEIIYQLIRINIQLDDFKSVNKYLDELSAIDNQINDLYVHQWWLLAKSLILRESTHYTDLGKTEEIYSEIIKGKELDQKITIIATSDLSELQLNYLLKTNDPELLKELEINLVRLNAMADLQDSYILFIETYLLQAQVAVLTADIQKAYDLLNQARSLAQVKELQRLANEVSNYYDFLNTKLELWEKLYRINASLVDLLELTPYEEGLKQIARGRITQKVLELSEDPILFIIQDPGGTSMFSKKFLPNSEFDEQLISAFLFAINNFMQETFAGKGSIDRITYLDYTLLFKPQEPFLICYAYKGQSYTAQQKLDLFTEKFGHNLSVWQALLNYTETGLVPELDDLIILENLVDEIFNPKDTSLVEEFDEESIEEYLSDLLNSKL